METIDEGEPASLTGSSIKLYLMSHLFSISSRVSIDFEPETQIKLQLGAKTLKKRMGLGFAARLLGFERCHRGAQCRLIAGTTQEGGLEMTPSLTLAADYMRCLPCSVI